MTDLIRSTAIRLLVAVACAALPAGSSAAAAGDDAPIFRIEPSEGAAFDGRLQQVSPAEVTVESEGGIRRLPVESIRRIERLRADGAGGAGGAERQAAAVRLMCTNGSLLEGDDFAWDGGQATLLRREGPIELPIGMVRSVAWASVAKVPKPDGGDDDWFGGLRESLESDLVVVAKGEGVELVECAITAVSPDAVTVVLDEEKIPVKRSKVVGLHWLRDAAGVAGAPETGFTVDLSAGSLRAGTIEWTPDGLVLDGKNPDRAVRMPAALLERIDFAAGRTTFLASVPTEKTAVEPFFGGLGGIDGLAAFFAPRAVPATEFDRPGLVMRPRTVAVWRIPAGSRRFRTTVAPATAQQPSAVPVVAVAVDDREVFRRAVDEPRGLPIDVDCTGGRRLTLTVDFGTAGVVGGAVRFTEPAIEK
jgi:hypothetical protein